MGGLLRPIAPLMLKTRGAVHQPVNSLPSGWPSIFPPLWYKPFEQPCPQPLTHCPLLTLLCPCPSLVCSSPCLRSCFPTLALAESSDPPPPFNHLPPTPAASCYSTLNTPGIFGIVYVSEFCYSLAAFLIIGMLMERWGDCRLLLLRLLHPPTIIPLQLLITPVRPLIHYKHIKIWAQGLHICVCIYVFAYACFLCDLESHSDFGRSAALQSLQVKSLLTAYLCVLSD